MKAVKTGNSGGHQDVPADIIEITGTVIGEEYADK